MIKFIFRNLHFIAIWRCISFQVVNLRVTIESVVVLTSDLQPAYLYSLTNLLIT